MGGSDQHRTSDVLRRSDFRRDATQAQAASDVQAILSALGGDSRKGDEAAAGGVLGKAMEAEHRRAAGRTEHQNFRNAEELIRKIFNFYFNL